jgi:rhodanese-related sulfurtransferase
MSKSKAKQTAGKSTASKSGTANNPASSQKKPAKNAKSPVNLWLIIAAVAVVAVIAAIAFLPRGNSSDTTATASLPKEISVAQAKDMYDSGAYVLDVRQPEEWNQVHIPGTTLIPLGELQNRLDEVPKGKDVVVVCRSGNRSQQGRDILLNAGFDQVTSMAGGVNQWSAAGYPTTSGP